MVQEGEGRAHEMPDFSIKTLGSRDSREIEAKAAESGTLLFFAIGMIEKHKARMSNPTPLLEAGKALREYMDITRSHGLRLPTAAHDRLSPRTPVSCTPVNPRGSHGNPKVHLAVHLELSAGQFGNPRLLGNWIDESDNRKLSLVASTAAAPIWHKRILSAFAHEAGPSASSTTKEPKH